ncbi:ATP-binding cassette domain-containing protein [Celerinatantimonas sp. YJH-8]|uniref:ATP-binding cassette domain-containing protein n=1 Tax=Celerinatantimonas sp. YJH-8 TaxID=3228714 RepID=UPI0038C99F90
MIEFEQCQFQKDQQSCFIKSWQIASGQHTCIIAGDNSPSLLADYLCDEAELVNGTLKGVPGCVGVVSLSVQQRLLEREKANDETDLTNEVDPGSSVEELLTEVCLDPERIEQVMADCGLTHLRSRGFFMLSTGETRRLMLARAILQDPELLVLDEPYAGLDKQFQQQLGQLLDKLSQHYQLLMITSRDQELPACFSQIALFDDGQFHSSFEREQWLSHPLRQQWLAMASEVSSAVVATLSAGTPDFQNFDPLFAIQSGKVAYHDGVIFQDLDWQIHAGEHWQVRGPNGCGKSTLLNLIFGDHPQCYSNQIELFGTRRGSGESIWQVKQRIGMVSSALHLQYRVNTSALNVVISGFYDSIGLYQQPSYEEKEQALAWLSLLKMEHLAKKGFRELSYGQQRLLLIARALIKHPLLLLLDEPCQGLDYFNRKLVLQALSLIAQQQLTQMVYVSHHDDEAISGICNFVDFVKAGSASYTPQISRNVQ